MSLCAFCFLSQGCTSQEVRFFLWRAVEKFKGAQAGILSAMVDYSSYLRRESAPAAIEGECNQANAAVVGSTWDDTLRRTVPNVASIARRRLP
jgi:hypothetical protein